MGAFFSVGRDDAEKCTEAVRRIAANLREQGFQEPASFRNGHADFSIYPKQNLTPANCLTFDDGDFIFQVGTMFHRGSFGTEALRLFYRDFEHQTPDWKETYGHFCIVLQKQGRSYLLTDPLGIYKVYRSRDANVISSSFLAVLSSLDRPRLNTQEVYEYVFQGATYGDKTLVDGIDTLPAGSVLSLDNAGAPHLTATATDFPAATEPSQRHPERNLENLRRYFSVIAGCMGDSVDTALSGGYDSRLILALLREQGINPRIHVYGTETDDDVAMAKAMADGEGFTLECIDKSRHGLPDPDHFLQTVEANYRFFDGCPADGIFDGGADAITRLDRCKNGELMLNGGGGEVFRNFFYLPNRPFGVKEILWTFYSQYDPSFCTARFDEQRYLAQLGRKICDSVGAAGDRLSRRQVEMVYPLFRCRYWMGKNNSVNNRLGWASTPFIDHHIVWDALDIPLFLKNSGRLEARMIAAADPGLASYPSAYGHGFDTPVPLRRRLEDLATRCKPPLLRRYSHRLKRRMGGEMPSPLLKPPYLSRVLDPSFPYMSQFFRIGEVRDEGQMNRLCTVEFLCQKVDVATPTE